MKNYFFYASLKNQLLFKATFPKDGLPHESKRSINGTKHHKYN